MRRCSRRLRAGHNLILAGVFLLIGLSGSGPVIAGTGAVSLTVDGARHFQRIDGFGVNANPASWKNGELKPALDILVDELGATLWRVIVENGNWETVNDDSDPNTFNWAYYNTVYESPKFQGLWNTIAHLNAKGAQVMLNVMGVVPSWMGGNVILSSAEDEWVEMIASLVYYGRNVRKVRFSMLSPLNETDLGPSEGPSVSAAQYVRLLRKLILRLEAVGLGDVRIVAPDTAYVDQATSRYMPALLADRVVMAKIDHFAVHNYGGYTGAVDRTIKDSAYADRNFWLTEWAAQCDGCDIGQSTSDEWAFARASMKNLFHHLHDGAAAGLVYDAYDSVYEHHRSIGRWGLLAYDSASGRYTPRKRFYTAAQVFRFTPPGSLRIAASESSGALEVYAFYHAATGRLTIIGHNSATTPRTIGGRLLNLPAVDALAVYQTTATANLQRMRDAPVAAGKFSVEVAPDSFFTLTGVAARPN